MDMTLPTGHVLRAPTADDAPAVAVLLRAREQRDVGEAEVGVEDVLTDWHGADLAADARVVEDGAARIVGYGIVRVGVVQIAVHADAEGAGIGTELRAAAEEAARARGTRLVRQFVPTANTAARILLLDAGWWPVHHYLRMQIALKHAPAPPDALTRPFDPERDIEALWHLMEGAHADVEGHLPQRARGRGHGRTLLLVLLAAFRAKRLWHAEVAAHGPTAAAARLFESVGMTPARQSERWEKSLAV